MMNESYIEFLENALEDAKERHIKRAKKYGTSHSLAVRQSGAVSGLIFAINEYHKRFDNDFPPQGIETQPIEPGSEYDPFVYDCICHSCNIFDCTANMAYEMVDVIVNYCHKCGRKLSNE